MSLVTREKYDTLKEKAAQWIIKYNDKLEDYEQLQEEYQELQEEYKELCSELHSYMDDIASVDQSKFQKLVGKIEVIGELLIRNKKSL